MFPLPLWIKSPSVKIRDLVPEMWQAIAAFAHTLHDFGGTHVVVTSGNDGKHMPRSYHYDNRAVDMRIWDITDPGLVHTARTYNFTACLRERLGPEYDVLLKPTHIHIEPSPEAEWGKRDIS
jgi:hypothetical protein